MKPNWAVWARKCRSLVKRCTTYGTACGYYGYNAAVTHLPGYAIRTAYLRRILGLRIGEGTAIHMGCFFTGQRIEIGPRTVVNRNCYLDGRGALCIGRNVSISPEVYILTATHDADDRWFAVRFGPVTIEDRVWVGARAMILPGVTLAEGTVVGAGAVVTRSTAPYSIVAGNPARTIRERSRKLSYELRYFPYFNTDIGQ